MNLLNGDVWGDENPDAVLEDGFQRQFSLNIWVEIVGDRLIGPIFLYLRVRCIEFFVRIITWLLQDMQRM